jgi:hypothetical protein
MHLSQITGIHSPSLVFFDPTGAYLIPIIIGRFLLFAISIAGLYFFYQLITTGLSYMTSMGDEARLSQLQKQLTNAVIGLLAVICAFFIMQILQAITGANLL